MALFIKRKMKSALRMQRKLNKAAYNRYRQTKTIANKKAAARILCFAAAEFLLFILIFL